MALSRTTAELSKVLPTLCSRKPVPESAKDGIVFTPWVLDVTVYIVTPFCPGIRHFEICAYQRFKSSGLKTNKNCVQAGTRFPLLCSKTRSNQHHVRILHGYLKKGYVYIITERPAACTVLGTCAWCWCCVHRLSSLNKSTYKIVD